MYIQTLIIKVRVTLWHDVNVRQSLLILVALGNSRCVLVVADAVVVGVAAGNIAMRFVEVIEERLSYHHVRLVLLDRRVYVLEDVHVEGRRQWVGFVGVLVEVEEQRRRVRGHAVARALVAVEVVFDRESAIAPRSVLLLAQHALCDVMRLVLSVPDRHQVVLAVVEERVVGRCATIEYDFPDALAVVHAVDGQRGASEVSCRGDDVHGRDEFVGYSWRLAPLSQASRRCKECDDHPPTRETCLLQRT